MCLLTGKIKFCTCNNASVNELENYWILHRFSQHKQEWYVGETVLSPAFEQANFLLNKQILEKRINESDAFDTSFTFLPDDHLFVHISAKENEQQGEFEYFFVYQQGRWISTCADHLMILNHYEKIASGKLQ